MENNDRPDWRTQRNKKSFLALEDGTIFNGYSVGAPVNALGEVVFNTGMTGYQEILSDPSYSGQFVAMTCAEIGNTGINDEDMESGKFFVNGFMMHGYNVPSNWRAEESLSDCLKRKGIPGLAGVDTRALTTKLRECGTLKGFMCADGSSGITPEQGVKEAGNWVGLDGKDYAAKVTCEQSYIWDADDRLTRSWGITNTLPDADIKVVAIDFGIKWNILRSLRRNGMRVTVVPAQTASEKIMALKPDGVFLSNGPADPSAVTYAIDTVRKMIGKVPMMGICLGHQILGIAMGGKTYRLKFGHHGCNHPVKDLISGEIEITSQNHNFAVDHDSLDKSNVEITHINLNDKTVEGMRHRKEPVFSVQYHPEACPGPHDPYYLFKRFRDLTGA